MRVQIADTCKVYRLGLRELLTRVQGVTFAPDIESAADLLPKAKVSQADMLVCNVQLLEQEIQDALSQLRKNKKLRTLIYAHSASCYTVQAAMVNDVAGYVLMEEIEAEVPLAAIVNMIARGQRWFSPAAQHHLLPRTFRDLPTPRESQVLGLMIGGMTPKKIATKLNTSYKYVYKIQSTLRQKFNASTNLELVAKSRGMAQL